MTKPFFILIFIGIILSIHSCSDVFQKVELSSPDEKVVLLFNIDDNGAPEYQVNFKDESVILPSKMGFEFTDAAPIMNGLKVIGIDEESFETKWEMPWGEKREVLNKYNSLRIRLQEKRDAGRVFVVHFKLYNDGLGFRYEFPEQNNFSHAYIAEENTEFNLNGNHRTYWIPGDWDIYEHLYNVTRLSEIDALKYQNHPSLGQTYIPYNAVNTPVTMVTESGLNISLHEANLTDYSGMTLKLNDSKAGFISCLVGSENTEYKVERKLPFNTPWRTIQISEKAAGLIESDMIVNLNEPNKIGDVSWFTPMKYVGIWWDMHLGTRTWSYSNEYDKETKTPGKPHGQHGATTEYTKELIDFASEHNIGGILVEGWNVGWEHWIGFEDREGVFDFVTSYEDYDLEEVVRYGKEKGVQLIMHHETSAATATYTAQLDTAYSLMQSLGIHSVKTGYVGKILPKGEYHHGQYMVRHYHHVLETAAKYQVAINAHEPIKATGKRRTYPNAIAREGLRGQEFNAWSSDGGNPPEHLPIVAFTRMLGGPIDFTPGIFNIKLEPYKDDNQVSTTLSQQLALYVVINSPIQMAADLIKYYKGHPAFKFIEDVGVNWEQTKILNGEVGEYLTTAREERETGNWFVGSITNEEARNFDINFDFLPDEVTFDATIYKDAEDAHWDTNPTAYVIEKMIVTNKTILPVHLAEGGGVAISLIKK